MPARMHAQMGDVFALCLADRLMQLTIADFLPTA